MKVLIVYSTRQGVSRQASEMLAQRMGNKASVSLFNIMDTPPAPDGFDAVVIGGSIRFGKLNKALKKYIKNNTHTLSSIPCAAFLCCGISKDFNDYATMQLPKGLKCSLGIHYFGGELKPDKIKGFDKLIVKIMRENILTQDIDISERDKNELPELMTDTIFALAERICRLK